MVLTHAQAVRYLYALTCYDVQNSRDENFDPIIDVPTDLLNCVRASSDPLQAAVRCINAEIPNPQDHVQGLSLVPQGGVAREACQTLYSRSQVSLSTHQLRPSFIRSIERFFNPSYMASFSGTDRQFIETERDVMAQQFPTVADVSSNLFSDRIGERHHWPSTITLHSPMCRNGVVWHTENLSVPGLRYQVPIIFPENRMSEWREWRENILFSFEVLKLVLSEAQIESLLHSEGFPDFSITYPLSRGRNSVSCGKSPEAFADRTHYIPQENRIRIGSSSLEPAIEGSPLSIQDPRSRRSNRETYFSTDFLYSFLNAFGQAYYHHHLGNYEEYAEAFRALVQWTNSHLEDNGSREIPPVSEITHFSRPSWWAGVPVFSENFLSDHNNRPRAVMSPADFVGDLLAERALFLFMERGVRGQSLVGSSINLNRGYLGARYQLTPIIFSGRPIVSMKNLIHAHYSLAGIDLDWDRYFYPPTSRVIRFSTGMNSWLGATLRAGIGYQWNAPRASFGLGVSLGVYSARPEVGVQCSVNTQLTRSVSVEAQFSLGAVFFSEITAPFVGLQSSFHYLLDGHRSIFIGTSLKGFLLLEGLSGPDFIYEPEVLFGVRQAF